MRWLNPKINPATNIVLREFAFTNTIKKRKKTRVYTPSLRATRLICRISRLKMRMMTARAAVLTLHLRFRKEEEEKNENKIR